MTEQDMLSFYKFAVMVANEMALKDQMIKDLKAKLNAP